MPKQRYDLNPRLIDFAIMVSSLVQGIRDTPFGQHVSEQLIRSATAPAANHAEAQGAESRRDFVHKLRIALKELKETRTWLQLIDRKGMEAPGLDLALDECEQLIAIIAKSVQTATVNVERSTLNDQRSRNDQNSSSER